jgi:DNA-binding transcriptional LysR family regulator
LTQQIQALERDLGVRLFQRTKRAVHLTEAGRLILDEALRTLQQAERTRLIANQAGRGEKGLIEIGYVGSAAFSGVLARTISAYRKTNPNVELRLDELSIQQLLGDLSSNRLDAAFLRLPVKPWPVGLASAEILSEPLVVAVPTTHALAKNRAISIASLADEPFIAMRHMEGVGFHAQVEQICRRHQFVPRITQRAQQFGAIASLVGAGLGVALVPASIRHLNLFNVTLRPLADVKEVTTLAIVFRKSEQAPAVLSFIQKVRHVVRG